MFDLDAALVALPRLALEELLLAVSSSFVRRSAIKREIAANGRSPQAYAMVRNFAAKRRVLSILYAARELHPETVAAQNREHNESIAAAKAMRARTATRQAQNRKAVALGFCPRCQGTGYIPNVIQDGAVCYRCYGSGR
jgi:hypothetical protein